MVQTSTGFSLTQELAHTYELSKMFNEALPEAGLVDMAISCEYSATLENALYLNVLTTFCWRRGKALQVYDYPFFLNTEQESPEV